MLNKWDLNYLPDKGDRIGVNLILRYLKDTSFVTQDGVTISKKRVPTDMMGFAKLNPPEQAHLLAQIFTLAREKNGYLMYNKTLWQYACQIERYFRKLYKSQYMKLYPEQQMRTMPRTFNLTDAVYAKAMLALDQQTSKSVRDVEEHRSQQYRIWSSTSQKMLPTRSDQFKRMLRPRKAIFGAEPS